MKILTYSDLHLEFGEPWLPPSEDAGDVLVLAGDTVTLRAYKTDLNPIFDAWKKPILYVMGNHEYYAAGPMGEANEYFGNWLKANHPHVQLLLDEPTTIDGVNFFGGTMWTDFNRVSNRAMVAAEEGMSDYRLIVNPDGSPFRPEDSIQLHEEFHGKLREWFNTPNNGGPRVVVTHHAPCMNPNTAYRGSPIWPAFNSLDMIPIMEEYCPDLWIYGHTHENDVRRFVHTQIVSNQRGYPRPDGSNECRNFREDGVPTEL